MAFSLYIWTEKQVNFRKSFTLYIRRSGHNMRPLFNKLYHSNFFYITIRNISHMYKWTLSISHVLVQMSRFRLLYIRVVHHYKMYNFDYSSNRGFIDSERPDLSIKSRYHSILNWSKPNSSFFHFPWHLLHEVDQIID